ncbi:MAG: PGF-CTERM sorting domain-containing protein, partial [Euryarchaeota archaeon]|nr:PGF-CTERM sorting domain-containing protein [Euryarchaeota archaeon]
TVTTTAAPTAPPGVTHGVTPGQVATPVEAVETPAEVEVETPAPVPPSKKGIPGFTSVFAIAGLLAALYLVLRRRE